MADPRERDIDCLLRILDYCDRIEALVDRFGRELTCYQGDEAYQDAVKMNLFQHFFELFVIVVDIRYYVMHVTPLNKSCCFEPAS